MQIQLSVLDQTPIRINSNASEALQESIKLVTHTDQLGFTRYWLSEHHNTITLAGAAPEVFIARLAAETKNIRLGSGGIMLPNHSALKVAENFRLLEALYPGRIDLGIGRAPGGDRLTARLLNPSNTFDPKDYVEQISDLYAYFSDASTPGTAQGKIRAIPTIKTSPEMWMLTSSGESAYLAAHFGMAVSFAQFINPVGGPEAIQAYRERFRPSTSLSEPKASVGLFGFCSDDPKKVKEYLAVMDYRLLSFEKGNFDQIPSYEAVKDEVYSPYDLQRIRHNRGRIVAGTPSEFKQQIETLARSYGVHEFMIATFCDEFADRLRSYELIGEVFKLKHASQKIEAYA